MILSESSKWEKPLFLVTEFIENSADFKEKPLIVRRQMRIQDLLEFQIFNATCFQL